MAKTVLFLLLLTTLHAKETINNRIEAQSFTHSSPALATEDATNVFFEQGRVSAIALQDPQQQGEQAIRLRGETGHKPV